MFHIFIGAIKAVYSITSETQKPNQLLCAKALKHFGFYSKCISTQIDIMYTCFWIQIQKYTSNKYYCDAEFEIPINIQLGLIVITK